MNEKNLFISYCWDDRDEVDELVGYIHAFFPEINIIRDTKDLKNGMNIKEFMRRIRRVDYAAIFITDKFLRSKNCMYEITELIEENNYNGKIIPFSIDNFNFFDENRRTIYYDFWLEQMNKSQILYNKYHNQDYKTHILLCTKIWYYLDDFFNHLKDIKFFNYCALKFQSEENDTNEKETNEKAIGFFEDFGDHLELNINVRERYEIFFESWSWSFLCFDRKKYKEFCYKYETNWYAQYLIQVHKEERKKNKLQSIKN